MRDETPVKNPKHQDAQKQTQRVGRKGTRRKNLLLQGVFGALALAILAGCASIGRPTGGPRDEHPPVFVRSNPLPGALNVNRKRLEIYFDENVQLDDAFNKVIVSPSQTMSPIVRSLGHRVTVELRDTLVLDATYTIDFGDAIKDLNEGNVLDGFALDFSTGESIDSLRVSGVLLEARTLEPAQGVLVGVYSTPEDSAITTLPLERVSRTNSRGQFTIRGLKDRPYRVFAIDDVNRDNKWDRSEGIAFFDMPVVPSVEKIEVNDTLRTEEGADSIVTRPGVAYLPSDILLTWFKEDFSTHYLKDNGRVSRNKVNIVLSAPYDTAPSAEIVRTPALEGLRWSDITVADITPGNDTVTWWIKDPRALAVDSLTLAVTYPRTDSLENVVMYSDTIRFFYRPSSDELKKAKEKAKLQEKGADTIPEPPVLMEVRNFTGATHDVYRPVIIEATTPWADIDTTKVHFRAFIDSLWTDVAHGPLEPIEGQTILRRKLQFDPVPGMKYRLEADSAAFTDIYGNVNKAFKHEFTVKELDKYSKLIFNVAPVDTAIVVELLDGRDNVVRKVKAENGRAVFEYVNPGTYYARMYYDDNGDGKWTPGNVAAKTQAEETAYYPAKIDARANWDVDLTWDIYATPLDVQKPYAIMKNKPKLKKGEKAPDEYGEEEEVDEWGRPINKNDRTNRNNTGFGGFGGFGGAGGGIKNSGGNYVDPRRR